MQRKATKQSRGPSSSEKQFIGKVKWLDCVVCGHPGPSIVDHIYGSSKKIMVGLERVHVGHFAVLALCYCCDQIKTRGSRRAFEEQFGSQVELWLKMIRDNNLMNAVPSIVIEAIAAERVPSW